MVTCHLRVAGPLYRESFLFVPPGQNQEVTAILVADSLQKAEVQDSHGVVLDRGSLRMERGRDQNQKTRVLLFVPKDNRRTFVVLQEPLTAQ